MMREIVIQLIEEWSYIYTCPAAMGALAWRREAMPL